MDTHFTSPEEKLLFRRGILEARKDGERRCFLEMKDGLTRILVNLLKHPGQEIKMPPFFQNVADRAIKRAEKGMIDVVETFFTAVVETVRTPLQTIEQVDAECIYEVINTAWVMTIGQTVGLSQE